MCSNTIDCQRVGWIQNFHWQFTLQWECPIVCICIILFTRIAIQKWTISFSSPVTGVILLPYWNSRALTFRKILQWFCFVLEVFEVLHSLHFEVSSYSAVLNTKDRLSSNLELICPRYIFRKTWKSALLRHAQRQYTNFGKFRVYSVTTGLWVNKEGLDMRFIRCTIID